MSGFGVLSLLILFIIQASSSLVHCGDVPDFDDSDFSLFAYCKSACRWGRGGNVCNCHAAYFTGKRSSSSASTDRGQVPGSLASFTGIDRPSSVDDNSDTWTALAAERHPLTKLPPGTAERDGDSETEEDDVEQRWWTATEELRRHLRSTTSNSVRRWRP